VSPPLHWHDPTGSFRRMKCSVNLLPKPIRIALISTVLLLVVGCDPGINVLNVQPVVTAIGPVTMDGDEVTVVFWAYDYEENSVDAEVNVEAGGQTNPVVVTGGHGLNGLTTSREDTGRAHILVFKPTGDPSESVTLHITLTDDNGGRSDTAQLSFTPSAGLAEPVPTQ
jgi:hypothetical protein